MMRKLRTNNILFMVAFFALLVFLGFNADKNLFDYKFFGKSESNYEFVGSSEHDFITEYTTNFPYKTSFVDLNGLGRKLIGQREMNSVVKLENGYLIDSNSAINMDAVEKNSNAVIAFNDYCREHGTTVLYVQPAYTVSKYDEQLPVGSTETFNENIDLILSRIADGGVLTMDLRETMHEDGVNQYDMYYRTDHHWSTRGGFYAYQKVAKWIAELSGTELDEFLLDLNNYQIDTYLKWHCGSRAQRTGALFAGIDDFELIYPKFETRIERKNDKAIMSLKDALVRMDIFEKSSAQNRYTYDQAYIANDINNLVSLDAKTDLSVWLMSDSYQHAIKQYMLLTYKDFHVTGYGTLSTAFIQKNQPDYVVILPYAGNIVGSKVGFTFVDDAVKTDEDNMIVDSTK